jgi:hypothetical protein
MAFTWLRKVWSRKIKCGGSTVVLEVREAAFVRILCELIEILSSVGMSAFSSVKDEIPALHMLVLNVEGLTEEDRQALISHADALMQVMKHRDGREPAKIAIVALHMMQAIRSRLGVSAGLMR